MYLFKHIYLLTKILIYFIESNSIMDLNKSPSMSIANSPPCSFIKSLAIANPKPLPSVFLESSAL